VITKSQLSKLVFALEKGFQMQQSVGRTMTPALDVDEIAHQETATIELQTVECPRTANPETVAQISSLQSIEEQLPLLEAFASEHTLTNGKMTDAIIELRNIHRQLHPPASESSAFGGSMKSFLRR
jgi:hypothetical protein